LAVLFSLFFLIGGTHLLAIFTDDPKVLEVGSNYLIWIIIYPILAFASYIWDGIFIGLTASKAMRDTMFLSLIAFVVSYFALQQFENHGLWMAMLAYVTVRGILQTVWYKYKINY
jgi:MATE family multidrug resistance protein